jgi:hypothetical protein
MEKVMKIEIILGDTKNVWAEIAPSTIGIKHKEDFIRATARKMWFEARNNGDLRDLHGAFRMAKVRVTCGNGLVTIEL